jgi:hypothetical protein
MPTTIRNAPAALQRAAQSWVVIICASFIFSAFAARHAFDGGILADNDSVSHYAYLRVLLDDVGPHANTHLGFCQRFGLGIPYLLYNTPPGLYVAAAALTKIFHLAPERSLIVLTFAAYASLPILGALLARNLAPDLKYLPAITAVMLGTSTSELFGLEFFFKNGMLNAAVALPLAPAMAICFVRARERTLRDGAVWLAGAAVLFAALLLTHVQTAYMGGLLLAGLVLSAPWRRWAGELARVAFIVVAGAALSAYWLVPSTAVVLPHVDVFHWARGPELTALRYFFGTFLSVYVAAFRKGLVTYSGVGFPIMVLAVVGVVFAVKSRARPVLAFIGVSLFALWLSLGPPLAGPLAGLPGYERLLWYRFTTLAAFSTLMITAYGAARVLAASTPSRRRRLLKRVTCAAIIGTWIWSAVVAVRRSGVIRTERSFPEQAAELRSLADWLRAHDTGEGRIYSEFLADYTAAPTISVNYARKLLPTLTSIPEVGAWVYENSDAAQRVATRGVMWNSPVPMIDLAERYGVRWIVAESDFLNDLLSSDARWIRRVTGERYTLWESATDSGRQAAPRPKTDPMTITPVRQAHRDGGGFTVDFQATGLSQGSHEIVVKTGYSKLWHGTVNGRSVPLAANEDGLIIVPVPADAGERAEVHLEWEVDRLKSVGRWLSVFALVALGVASALLRRFAIDDLLNRRKIVLLAPALLVAGAIVCTARAVHADAAHMVSGFREGVVPYRDDSVLELGTYRDHTYAPATSTIAVDAWGTRHLVGQTPARVLFAMDGGESLLVVVNDHAPATLTIEVAAGTHNPYTLLARRGADIVCSVEARFGEPATVPQSCVTAAVVTDPGTLPTVRFGIRVVGDAPEVSRVVIHTPMQFIQAESMHIGIGAQAAVTPGPGSCGTLGGMNVAVGTTPVDSRSPIYRSVPLERGVRYRIFARVLAPAADDLKNPEYVRGRYAATLSIQNHPLATIPALPIGKRPPLCKLVANWRELGTFTSTGADLFEVLPHRDPKVPGFELDAFALIPEPNGGG